MSDATDQLAKLEPLLVPRPKSVELAHDTPRVSAVSSVHQEVTSSLDPHFYSLTIGVDGAATIQAGSERSASYAIQTLDQLKAQYGSRLPVLRIDDAPAFANRGVMLDVSRCRIPTMVELGNLLKQFSSLKLNHLQLYLEHAFAYQDDEPIWRGCSPFTGSEIEVLSVKAHELGIELAANQNCFGHLTRWLIDPKFADLAETHGDWVFANMPRSGPFSLCPTDDRSLEFVTKLLSELLPHFTHATHVNVGCDETYDVGQGRSLEAVQARGKSHIWGAYVAQVCNQARKHHLAPMIWGDIAAEHPDAIDLLPQETIGLVWGYEPSSNFLQMGQEWRSRYRRWWVCPGLSDWRSFTGRSAERRANIRNAAEHGLNGGADGLLATSWGDLGHRQAWPISLLGIAEAADAAWCGSTRHNSFLDAVSLHVFGDRSLKVASWLEELGDADREIRETSGALDPHGIRTPLLNASALFTELYPPPMELKLPTNPEPWSNVLDRLIGLREQVPAGAGPQIEDECRHAVNQAVFAAKIAIARRTPQSRVHDTAHEIQELKAEHERLWLLRSRPGGLKESLAFWDTIQRAKGVR